MIQSTFDQRKRIRPDETGNFLAVVKEYQRRPQLHAERAAEAAAGPIGNPDVMAHPTLSQTPAAQAGNIVRMDGMMLLGFGPRTPDAAKLLYDALYPKAG